MTRMMFKLQCERIVCTVRLAAYRASSSTIPTSTHKATRIYQSSSSSAFCPPPPTALCLALSASANPPAKLPPELLFGVALPLSVPLPVDGPRLTPLSLAGAGGGSGFLPPAAAPPATGRFDGGAGGVGFPFAGLGVRAAPMPLPSPFPLAVREARAGAAGGGGGGGAW
jgi:hypothetical protein